MNRAAFTYSRSRSVSVMPRTIRAVIIQLNSASSTTKISQVWPLNAGLRIARIRNEGSTSSRSTSHIRARSVQPPK